MNDITQRRVLMVGCWNLNPLDNKRNGLIRTIERLNEFVKEEEPLYMYVLGDNYYYTHPGKYD